MLNRRIEKLGCLLISHITPVRTWQSVALSAYQKSATCQLSCGLRLEGSMNMRPPKLRFQGQMQKHPNNGIARCRGSSIIRRKPHGNRTSGQGYSTLMQIIGAEENPLCSTLGLSKLLSGAAITGIDQRWCASIEECIIGNHGLTR